MDASAADPLSPRPKSAKPTGGGTTKDQETTSEDSDLFDSSQVDDIQAGVEDKARMAKRENWVSGKKQSKSGSVEASDGQTGAAQLGSGSGGSQDKDEKNNNSG